MLDSNPAFMQLLDTTMQSMDPCFVLTLLARATNNLIIQARHACNEVKVRVQLLGSVCRIQSLRSVEPYFGHRWTWKRYEEVRFVVRYCYFYNQFAFVVSALIFLH